MTEKKKSSLTEIQHYNAVLIEDLKSDFKFVIEALMGVEQRLNARIDALEAKFEARFDVIEKVLAYHSKKFEENDRRWEENDRRWDENERRWAENEKRWQACESQLLRIESISIFQSQRLQNHEVELARLSGR